MGVPSTPNLGGQVKSRLDATQYVLFKRLLYAYHSYTSSKSLTLCQVGYILKYSLKSSSKVVDCSVLSDSGGIYLLPFRIEMGQLIYPLAVLFTHNLQIHTSSYDSDGSLPIQGIELLKKEMKYSF